MKINDTGILLYKIPYKEKNLLTWFLLETGEKVSLIFYGAMGSLRKRSGNILQIGNAINLEFSAREVTKVSGPLVCKEWSLRWEHVEIKKNYDSFYLLCFYLELLKKISMPGNFAERLKKNSDHFLHDHVSLYKVLSNAIFYLEKNEKENGHTIYENHIVYFFVKLVGALGLLPNLSHCLYCDQTLEIENIGAFNLQEGGFSCLSCERKNVQERDLAKSVYSSFVHISSASYAHCLTHEKAIISSHILQSLYRYLCIHGHFNPRDIKSIPSLMNPQMSSTTY